MKRAPLAAFLGLQALLSFWNLGLLSPWGDEAATLALVSHSAGYAVQMAATDVHPPAFYLMLWVWQRLPLGMEPAVQARVLTVLLALAATLAADLMLGSRLAPRARVWFLALWCCSPCLLLYARMSRSYSMQALVTILAAGCLLRCLEDTRRRLVVATAIALLAALYTHYVPGLALSAAANLALLRRRRWRDLALLDTIVAVGFLPWAVWLLRSLEAWSRGGAGYAAIGGGAEYALKLAYWAMSFLAGEAIPDPVLAIAILAAPLVLACLWRGRRCDPALFALTALLAPIGFIAVARWVAYPFIPARVIFLLPLMLALAAAGAAEWRRAGTAVCALMLALSLSGAWCYFHEIGFRNKQYPMPMRQIAALMEPGSLPLVDATNSDPFALDYALGPARKVWRTTEPETSARLKDPSLRAVWFLRNTHDVSRDSLDARYEAQLERSMRLVSVRRYQPFTPLERRLMHALGMKDAPEYFSELLEFRR
ncbi:MAG: hypothetical protein JST11_24940 [Acidobacteria bacterium]|nr:hypothetical protein [Acidobacteriota bacterium]